MGWNRLVESHQPRPKDRFVRHRRRNTRTDGEDELYAKHLSNVRHGLRMTDKTVFREEYHNKDSELISNRAHVVRYDTVLPGWLPHLSSTQRFIFFVLSPVLSYYAHRLTQYGVIEH